jgi:hypothetical protein
LRVAMAFLFTLAHTCSGRSVARSSSSPAGPGRHARYR